MQELAEKVTEVVEPLRDQLDAVLVFPSMPEVMRLNKVGSFTMKNLGQSKSVVADFMKKMIRFAAAVMEDWYWDSSTTYTIFIVGRPRTSSGTIRRFSALEAVNMPPLPLPSSNEIGRG